MGGWEGRMDGRLGGKDGWEGGRRSELGGWDGRMGGSPGLPTMHC